MSEYCFGYGEQESHYDNAYYRISKLPSAAVRRVMNEMGEREMVLRELVRPVCAVLLVVDEIYEFSKKPTLGELIRSTGRLYVKAMIAREVFNWSQGVFRDSAEAAKEVMCSRQYRSGEVQLTGSR